MLRSIQFTVQLLQYMPPRLAREGASENAPADRGSTGIGDVADLLLRKTSPCPNAGRVSGQVGSEPGFRESHRAGVIQGSGGGAQQVALRFDTAELGRFDQAVEQSGDFAATA
jgi:hypothetical protein